MEFREALAFACALVMALATAGLLYVARGVGGLVMIVSMLLASLFLYWRRGITAVWGFTGSISMIFSQLVVHEVGHYVTARLYGYESNIGMLGWSTVIYRMENNTMELINPLTLPTDQLIVIALSGSLMAINFLIIMRAVGGLVVAPQIATELINLVPILVWTGEELVPVSDMGYVFAKLGLVYYTIVCEPETFDLVVSLLSVLLVLIGTPIIKKVLDIVFE